MPTAPAILTFVGQYATPDGDGVWFIPANSLSSVGDGNYAECFFGDFGGGFTNRLRFSVSVPSLPADAVIVGETFRVRQQRNNTENSYLWECCAVGQQPRAGQNASVLNVGDPGVPPSFYDILIGGANRLPLGETVANYRAGTALVEFRAIDIGDQFIDLFVDGLGVCEIEYTQGSAIHRLRRRLRGGFGGFR